MRPDAPEMSMQRIESTQPYKDEFERLLAAAARAKEVFHSAKAAYDRACITLEDHIESRHYARCTEA
jgi:hypothetical protein